MVSLKPKRKPKQKGSRKPYVKKACTNCKTAHCACNNQRPCSRCVQLGIESQCQDAERKKPATRKPRKQKRAEHDDSYPSLKEYLPFVPNFNGYNNSLVPTVQIPMNPNHLNGGFYFPNQGFGQNTIMPYNYNQPQQQPQLQPQQQMSKPSSINFYGQTMNSPQNNILFAPDTPTESKKDDNIDLYMDLSSLSPLNTPLIEDVIHPDDKTVSIIPNTVPTTPPREETGMQMIPFDIEKKGTSTKERQGSFLKKQAQH
jgi:hypothetical protein